MAKNKADTFEGLFKPIETVPAPQPVIIDSGKVTADKKPKRKAGRPVSNRETKKKYTFSLLPSLYDEFSMIVNATPNNKSVSELISDFMQDYINNHK